MAKAQIIQDSIKGVFGEEVNVGDQVMVVTTGYSHRVNVRKGIYKGYVESQGYYKGKRAKIEINTTRNIQVKPDGSEFIWRKDYNSATWPEVSKTLVRKEIPYTYQTTLQLNRIATIK
jgi:uncharacterized membrane protein